MYDVKGTHLWLVDVGNESLWVSTTTKNWQHVVAKAKKLVTSKTSDWYGMEIKKIAYSGTIDA